MTDHQFSLFGFVPPRRKKKPNAKTIAKIADQLEMLEKRIR